MSHLRERPQECLTATTSARWRSLDARRGCVRLAILALEGLAHGRVAPRGATHSRCLEHVAATPIAASGTANP